MAQIVQHQKASKKSGFLGIALPYWVFITLASGFLLGLYLPKNNLVHDLALSGTYFPKGIVTFAAPIIFFLLAGATAKLIMVHKDKAGRLFGRMFLMYGILAFLSLIWVSLFVVFVIKLPLSIDDGKSPTIISLFTSILGTFQSILTNQPLLQTLVAAVGVGWLAAINKRFHVVSNGIFRASDFILKVFKWLLWYYPIMIGCLAISIPLKFGTKGIAFYGKSVMWVAIITISWAVVLILFTKLTTKRSWKQIFAYFMTVYPTGFGTGGSYDTLAVNIISAEKDLKLSPQISEVSIVFGTVLNKSSSTMAVIICTITTCWLLQLPISFSEILLLILPIWVLGLESPGVPGGAGFFMSPIIATILQVPDPAIFVTTFVTMYSGLIPMLCTGVNTIGDGFIGAMLNDWFKPVAKGLNSYNKVVGNRLEDIEKEA